MTLDKYSISIVIKFIYYFLSIDIKNISDKIKAISELIISNTNDSEFAITTANVKVSDTENAELTNKHMIW